MQLTNLQVMNAIQGLNSLGQMTLPFKLAWKVTTAVRSLEPFAKAADESLRDIRMKYALRDALGMPKEALDKDGSPLPNTIQIPNDKIAIVNEEMDGLLQSTVEVQNVTLRLTDFPNTMEIQPSVLNALLPLISEEQSDLKLVP